MKRTLVAGMLTLLFFGCTTENYGFRFGTSKETTMDADDIKAKQDRLAEDNANYAKNKELEEQLKKDIKRAKREIKEFHEDDYAANGMIYPRFKSIPNHEVSQ